MLSAISMEKADIRKHAGKLKRKPYPESWDYGEIPKFYNPKCHYFPMEERLLELDLKLDALLKEMSYSELLRAPYEPPDEIYPNENTQKLSVEEEIKMIG